MSEGRIATLFLFLFTIMVVSPCLAAAASVEASLSEFINRFYGADDIRIRYANFPEQLKGNVKVRTISFSRVPDGSGDGICLVAIEGRHGAETSVQVAFRAHVKRTLYALKSNVQKGEAIRKDDISAKETFLNGFGAAYPVRIEEVVGKIAKKDLPAGEVLMKQHLEEPLAIQRGELVVIMAQNKRMVVQTKGVALEKGKLGDVVRARAPSGKEVIGRVSAHNTISVEF